jgi:hypothetical protein
MYLFEPMVSIEISDRMIMNLEKMEILRHLPVGMGHFHLQMYCSSTKSNPLDSNQSHRLDYLDQTGGLCQCHSVDKGSHSSR